MAGRSYRLVNVVELYDRWIFEDEPTDEERQTALLFLMGLVDDPTPDGAKSDPLNPALWMIDILGTRATFFWLLFDGDTEEERVVQGVALDDL